MAEPNKKKAQDKKALKETTPPCTTAASPEHSRAHDDDEPCDDGRTGKIDNGSQTILLKDYKQSDKEV